MKTRSIVSVLMIITLASGTAVAQISLSGEFRPRTEYSHGYGTLS